MQQIEVRQGFDQTISQDHDSLMAFYNQYERLIYSFAFRITQDEELAILAVKKAFLTVWRHPAPASPEVNSALADLFTLTRKYSLGALKGEWPLELHSTEDDSEWMAKGAELSQSLYQIKESQQKLLIWLYFEGLSQYAIAQRLRIPIGSVPSRIREAFHQLQPDHEKLYPESSCSFSSRLADYFSFQLNPEEAGSFEQHIIFCTRCQAELAAWQQLTQDFPYLSKMETPPEKMKEQILAVMMDHQVSLDSASTTLELTQMPAPAAPSKWLPVLGAALLLSIGANTYLAVSGMNNSKKQRKALKGNGLIFRRRN